MSIAVVSALLVLGACGRSPAAYENGVPPGTSLRPPPAAQRTGALVLPGIAPTADTVAAPSTPAGAAPSTPPPADTAAAAGEGAP